MSYPEVADDLEILLRTSLYVNWRASRIQPNPYFKARARAEFIRAQYQIAYDKHVASTKPTIFSLHRAWMPALAVITLVILTSFGTAAASSNAMPDQTLYPVKLATEQVKLTLAFSDQSKAELNMKFAETRTQEISTMAASGKTEQVIVATEKLEQNLIAAEQAIQRFETAKMTQPAPKPVQVTPQQPATTTPPPATNVPAPQPAPVPEPKPEPSPAPAKVEPVVPQPAPALAPTPKPEPQPEPAPAPALETKKGSDEKEDSMGTQEQAISTEREQKIDRLKKAFETTISRNIEALETAQKETPEDSKKAIQRAIEFSKKRKLWLEQRSNSTDGTPEVKPDENLQKQGTQDTRTNQNKKPAQPTLNSNIQQQTVPDTGKTSTSDNRTNTRNNSIGNDNKTKSKP